MISNTNEQGYGRTLTPNATSNDGKLNLVGLAKQNWIKLSIFIPFPIQIDGEYIELDKDTIAISLLKEGLSIITG